MQCRLHLRWKEQRNYEQKPEDSQLYAGAQANAVPSWFGIRKQGKPCRNLFGADGLLPRLWIAGTSAVGLKTDAHRRLSWWTCNHGCHPRTASWNFRPAKKNGPGMTSAPKSACRVGSALQQYQSTDEA